MPLLLMALFFPRHNHPHSPILFLYQNSFSHWSDWSALIFGIHVQKEKALYIYYTMRPCIIIYEVGTIYPFYRWRKNSGKLNSHIVP